jgi:hypothetical protein
MTPTISAVDHLELFQARDRGERLTKLGSFGKNDISKHINTFSRATNGRPWAKA